MEIRPVYHKKDDRIRSHVFLCVLAYYLQWHMQRRLQPLFAQDGVGGSYDCDDQGCCEATSVQVPASIPDALLTSNRKGSRVYGHHWWPNGLRPDGRRHRDRTEYES